MFVFGCLVFITGWYGHDDFLPETLTPADECYALESVIVFEVDGPLHRLSDGEHVNWALAPFGWTGCLISDDLAVFPSLSSTMQKRVHFAPTNTVFSPIPTTPSPSLSEASLPSDSSSELSTPPPEIEYSPAHYPRSPFPHSTELILHPQHHQLQHPQPQAQHTPSQASVQSQDVILKPLPEPGHMQIHYRLAFSPLADVPINFDLSLHWSQIEGQVPAHELNEPATSPPLHSLVIICSLVPWEFPVGPRVPGTHVSVLDVLYCLFRHLRLAVSREEYDTQAAGMTRVAVDSAYHARCARVRDPQMRAAEEAKGIKRVDFLQGRNIFKGLSGTLTSAHIWELNVA